MLLVDAHLCADPGKYLAALLLSLATMLHLELPQACSLATACRAIGVSCTASHFAKLHFSHWLVS